MDQGGQAGGEDDAAARRFLSSRHKRPFGADYCCLWHVFVYPRATYRAIAEQSPDRAKRLDDARLEFTSAYPGFVKAILSNY